MYKGSVELVLERLEHCYSLLDSFRYWSLQRYAHSCAQWLKIDFGTASDHKLLLHMLSATASPWHDLKLTRLDFGHIFDFLAILHCTNQILQLFISETLITSPHHKMGS